MKGPPSLLFIAPIVPAPTGNGLAMRAGVFLDAFARDFAVTLLVVPVAGGAAGGALPDFVTERTRRVAILSLDGKLDPLWELTSRVRDPQARAAAFTAYPRPALCRYATTPMIREVVAAVGDASFDSVHVMRSYLAPYAAPFLPIQIPAPTCGVSLDLDDDEVSTHTRLAALLEGQGASLDAGVTAAEALKYRRHEALWLPRFPLLVACTTAHAQRLATDYPASRQAIVPNTVVLPPAPAQRRLPAGRILFVGNLSYLPNVAGILGFIRDVLPRLRTRFAAVTLRILGSNPVPELRALVGLPGIELVESLPELTAHYGWADLAVVPLAAGGGTRIKLIEAFAQGVPVVATPIGAEGIDVQSETHLLLADSPARFADACARLLVDGPLAARLVASARRLVETRYAHDIAVALIRAAFQRVQSS